MAHVEHVHDREIAEARRRLDELDRRILRLLKERISVSALVQGARVAVGGCRTDLRREQVIISRYREGLGRGGSEIALSLLRLCRGAESRPVRGDGGGPVCRPLTTIPTTAWHGCAPVTSRCTTRSPGSLRS
ncbi:chorismate mutase [Streptomyces natalensis]|uniref:chorismate mutase n=1 Tax=Streptomyces natalensis TaxID=68242 RepID=UPI0007C530B3|nr:chorismate mutase [Streptomyces natalensis]